MADERQVARRDPLRSVASDPWREFGGLSAASPLSRMSRLMDDFFGESSGVLTLPLDLTETDDAYQLTIEVPGVKKEDLTIECSEHVITIRGEKKFQRDPERERAYRTERRYGVVARSVQLPDDADLERIEAAFEDGVLRVRVEKKPESKPRRIEIH